MTPIRVLIVEDSPTVSLLLQHAIGRDARLTVVETVASAEEMLDRLERVQPDVISLDIRLPGMNGLDATLEVMRRRPTPIVVVAAGVNSEDGHLAMDALRAGALAVVEKPQGLSHADYAVLAKRLCDQLVRMSKIKVVRQSMRRDLAFALDGAARSLSAAPQAAPWTAPTVPESYAALGIVASTGGPSALVTLLNGLGADYPLPILLVQHIVGSFLAGFTDWLSSSTPYQVRIAADGEAPQRGCVYVAPVEHHLALSGGRLRLDKSPPVGGQRPSGTLLLKSMAADLGPRAIGVVLTGMGSDGADGMLELYRVGAQTIAEDESTAVVYGMPAAAAKLGAVRTTLPLHLIAPRLRILAGIRQEGSF